MPSYRVVTQIALGVSLVLGPAVLPARAGAQDKPHPIVAEVKSKLKDPDKPFTMLVRLKVKEGAGKHLETAFAPATEQTRKEKGCIAYSLHRDAQDPASYLVFEQWASLADLDKHLKSDHITKLLAELGDVLDGAPEVRVMVPVGRN